MAAKRSKVSDRIAKFISDIEKKAEKHGVKIILEDAELVYAKGEKEGCAGYFDSENKILAASTKGKKSQFLGLLAHESSHLDQWIENRYMWDKLSHGYALFFEWLGGKIVKREYLEEAVQDIIRLEKDCELRAIKKIQHYQLPINLIEYKKKVNSYLYAYLFFLEKRKWIPKLYSSKKVWSKAPHRIPKEYKKIPRNLYRVFNSVCYQ